LYTALKRSRKHNDSASTDSLLPSRRIVGFPFIYSVPNVYDFIYVGKTYIAPLVFLTYLTVFPFLNEMARVCKEMVRGEFGVGAKDEDFGWMHEGIREPRDTRNTIHHYTSTIVVSLLKNRRSRPRRFRST
ncbi:hypothetical protein WG66_006061, partial [Moniliophthora roreri]